MEAFAHLLWGSGMKAVWSVPVYIGGEMGHFDRILAHLLTFWDRTRAECV